MVSHLTFFLNPICHDCIYSDYVSPHHGRDTCCFTPARPSICLFVHLSVCQSQIVTNLMNAIPLTVLAGLFETLQMYLSRF